MRTRRVLLIVFGSILALVGLAALGGGAFLLWAHQTQRDRDGFYTTRTERFGTPTHAIVTDDLDVTGGGPHWLTGSGRFGTIRVRAASVSPKAVFIGIGPDDAVRGYLEPASFDRVSKIDYDPFRVSYRRHPGGSLQGAPTSQSFWAARASGPGQQTLVWKVRGGHWRAVVMNSDAAPAVAVRANVGAKLGFLFPLSIGLLAGGAVVLAIAGTMIYFGARTRRRPPVAPSPPPT